LTIHLLLDPTATLGGTVTPLCHDGYMSSMTDAAGLVDREALFAAFAELSECDPFQQDRDGLQELVRRSLRVRGWLDAMDARIAVRAAQLAAVGTSEDASTVLAGGGRRSRRDAEAAADRGTVCARLPLLSTALANGTVTAGHVDAIASTARQLDDDGQERLADHEESLVEAAALLTPEQFGRQCRDLARHLSDDGGLSRQERMRRDRNVRRWVDRYTGLSKTLLSLDPLADAMAWTAINAALATARNADQRDDDRTWDQLQADVVVDLLTGARSTGEERVPEVSVLIDYQTLLDRFHDRSTCETSEGQPLPTETVRRLCCEANIVPIVLGSAGEVLDVGRQCRLANRAQRRSMRAMYRTCAHPDCTVGFDSCRIHHVIYWQHGGPSDLDNMIPLCERHHHLVHEGGWTLQLFPDRRTTWRTPDGTVHHDGITTDRTPAALGALATTAAVTDSPVQTSRRCRAERSDSWSDEAARVAAEMRQALADLTTRAPP
jgi:hypothetical protein